MANTRELRRRIKSVKSTAQITKAMQMVAASKMRKAQNQAVNGRPYTFNLSFALSQLLTVNIESHPLLNPNDAKTTGLILLTTDKGLNGALNTNLFRLITAADFVSADTQFYTVGKKGRNFIARLGKNLLADFANPDLVSFRQAMQLSKLIIDSFTKKGIGEAYVIYPQFISTLRQQPTKNKLLPIDYTELINSITTQLQDQKQENNNEFLFEPNISQLLDYLLLHYVQIKIYQALLETKASEHSATMIAMQNATDNALDIVDDLTLTYNQTRQDSITKELLEITTAAAVMG